MKSSVGRKYIIKESTGEEWCFFHLENTGICYGRVMDKKMNSYDVLLKDGENDFDVIVTSDNNIHLICQDRAGDIIYLTRTDDKWLKYIILKSKTNKSYRKYFKILNVKGQLNLLYIINYKEEKLLIHQILKKDNQSITPEVIGLIYESPLPFFANCDQSGNIYVYYRNLSTQPEEVQFGYCKYIEDKKNWQSFIAFENWASDKKTLPYLIMDKNRTTHAVYIKTIEDETNLFYSKGEFIDAQVLFTEEERLVAKVMHTSSIPVISIIGSKMWIMWQRGYNVFSCSSSDGGISWTMPSQFMTVRSGSIELFAYRTAVEEEISNISIDLIYGFQNTAAISLYILPSYIEQLKRMAPQQTQVQKQNDSNITLTNNSLPNLSSNTMPPNTSQHSNLAIDITKLKIELASIKEAIMSLNKKIDNLSINLMSRETNSSVINTYNYEARDAISDKPKDMAIISSEAKNAIIYTDMPLTKNQDEIISIQIPNDTLALTDNTESTVSEDPDEKGDPQ